MNEHSTPCPDVLLTHVGDALCCAEDLFISAAGQALRKAVTESRLLQSHGDSPVLIVWLKDAMHYTVATTPPAAAAIATTASTYLHCLWGLGPRVRVIFGVRSEQPPVSHL